MVAKTKKKKKSTIPTTTRPTNARNNTFTGIAPVQSPVRGLKPVGGIHPIDISANTFPPRRTFFFLPFFSRPSEARRGEARRVESSGEASECRVTSRPINDGEAGKRNGSDGADSTMEAAVFHSCARFRLAFPEKLFTKYYLSS